MTYAEQALIRLEKYEGPDRWIDCIDGVGFDEKATRAADPASKLLMAVYVDGSRLKYARTEHRYMTV